MTKITALLTTASLIFTTMSVVGNVAQAETKTPRPTENVCVSNDIYVSCDLLEDCLLSDGEIGTMDGVPVCFEDVDVKINPKLKGASHSSSGQNAVSTSPRSTSPVKSKLKRLSNQNSRLNKAVK